MAPQKTVVLIQQSQQVHRDNTITINNTNTKQSVKPRKRKGKQQAQTEQDNSKIQITQNSKTDISEATLDDKILPPTIQSNGNEKQVKHLLNSNDSLTSKTTGKKTQVPNLSNDKGIVLAQKKQVEIASTVVTPVPAISKQLSSEEVDDIDAGIELDGSSNSGSSVKDICEDNNKSASVSPIMAQSNTISNGNDLHAIEVQSIEQLTSSMCTPMKPLKKVATRTKQQLAANQDIIDADEQQIQEKLQLIKPRKSSLINSDSNITGQAGSLCKVCQQHVYQMERILAEKSVYHMRCFRCHQCKIQLRVDNYSSHEGQVYCKAHHRQIFQPQVKLNNEDDVDIVTKSRSRQRQMIICENEPAELSKDVVRCDAKLDDGIDQLNLNLNNILEKFERGNASDESQPSSAGVVIDKPSFNIKQTLMAFESKLANEDNIDIKVGERPVVKKLNNISGFLNRQNSSKDDEENISSSAPNNRPVKRSESLMMRLKKYELRIAGERVDDDDDDDDDDDGNNNNNEDEDNSKKKAGDKIKIGIADSDKNHFKQVNKLKKVFIPESQSEFIDNAIYKEKKTQMPKKLNLSTLKNQWENGDINNRKNYDNDDSDNNVDSRDNGTNTENGEATGEQIINGNSPIAQKNEELSKIRQQLARRKQGESGSIKNIYENAIKEARLQSEQQASRRDSSDLSALNGFSTSNIQQQLLQNGSSNSLNYNKTPTSPNKDHLQLNLTNKANKLKERFEQGLINNSSHDDSDLSDDNDSPALTKLEQIRQEKLEDLSIFTEGEIKAREARSLFQQIDRRLSASNTSRQPVNPRSLASIGANMRNKLTNHINSSAAQATPTPSPVVVGSNCYNNETNKNQNHHHNNQDSLNDRNHQPQQQPIRLTNNVRT